MVSDGQWVLRVSTNARPLVVADEIYQRLMRDDFFLINFGDFDWQVSFLWCESYPFPDSITYPLNPRTVLVDGGYVVVRLGFKDAEASAENEDTESDAESSAENEGTESDAGSDTPSLSCFLPLSYLEDGSDLYSDDEDTPEDDDGAFVEVRDNHNRPRLHLKRIGSLWKTIGNLKEMITEEVRNLVPSSQPSLTVLDFNLVHNGVVMQSDEYIADFLNYPTERKLVVRMILRLRGGGKKGVRNDASKQKQKEKKNTERREHVSNAIAQETTASDCLEFCRQMKQDISRVLDGADSDPRETMRLLLEGNPIENLDGVLEALGEKGNTENKVANASHSMYAQNGVALHRLLDDVSVIKETSRSAFVYLYEKCGYKDVGEFKSQITRVRDVKFGRSQVGGAHKLPEFAHKLPEFAHKLPEFAHKLPEFARKLVEFAHKLPEFARKLVEFALSGILFYSPSRCCHRSSCGDDAVSA